jgi:hypothetical protein
MKKIAVLIMLSLFTKTTFAQKNGIKAIYKNITEYTDSIFRHSDALNRCISGYAFIRFDIDKVGKIIKVQTSEGTPAFLDSLFKKVLVRKTPLFNKLKATKTLYLLPVFYNLHYNCPIDTSYRKKSPLETLLKTMPTETVPNKDTYVYSFLNMINFKKTTNMSKASQSNPLKCILLAPYELITPTLEQGYVK